MFSSLHSCSEVQSFSALVRDRTTQLPYAVPLPDTGSVFDYCVDLKTFKFIPWAEGRIRASMEVGSDYISVPEVHYIDGHYMYSYFVDFFFYCCYCVVYILIVVLCLL